MMSKQGKNIYHRKDGRWEGRYIKGRSSEGRIQYGYVFGKTFEDVENGLSRMPIHASDSVNTASITFSELSIEWLNVQKPELKASSIAKYSNILELYLVPEYGQKQIQVISRSDVIFYSRTLLSVGGKKSQGLAPKTVNSIISVMKNILEYASREKSITVADIRDVFVKQPQKPMRILSRSEQQKISKYLYDNPTPCHLGILLCLYTGLRIGEICALKWKDICFDEKFLYVHQSMQRVQSVHGGEKKTEVLILAPKSTCSIRQIPIPDEMMTLLHLLRKQDDAFLLTGSVHSYIEPRSMENHFKSVIQECNIRDVNFHVLRHTFATRCVELGFDIKSLSEILGHASVNITLNRYVHPSMELKQKNMNMLSELFITK